MRRAPRRFAPAAPARAAGKRARRRHFADRRALLTAVATEGFRELRRQLVAAWEEGHGGPVGFRAMGVAYVRFAVANPSHYRVMFSRLIDVAPQEPELAAEAEGAFKALVDSVAALQRAGFVRGDDTALVARFVWAVVHGVAMLAIDRQLPDPGDAEELMQYALDRLGTAIWADTR